MGFYLYLLFIISWFIRLTVRFPVLGSVRFDLLLILVLFIIFVLDRSKKDIKGFDNPCYKKFIIFFIFTIVVVPFAEWPGSVLKFGLPNYIKGIVFFLFTLWFVRTEKQLKILVTVFLLCQSFRVIEPLYLHVTQGYWGSRAYMGPGQFMDRLSGAPADIIGPNGLAFVVLTILPFLLNLYRENVFYKLFAILFVPVSMYALYLTGSRSGMLGLLVILLIFAFKSKYRFMTFGIIFMGVLIAAVNMEGVFKDRYASIYSDDTDSAATAQGRIDGVFSDFKLGLRKPIVGHGLGTSYELSANYGSGRAQISHNLYAETFQEVGAIGLVLFLSFIYSMFINILKTKQTFTYLGRLRNSLLIFASMNLFFAMASYGLSSYEWYFLAALSIILFSFQKDDNNEEKSTADGTLARGRNKNISALRISSF